MNNFLANGSRMAVIAAAIVLGFVPLYCDARPAAAQGAAGNAQNGKAIYASQKCGACHGPDAQGGSGQTAGPQIAPPRLAMPMFADFVRNPKDPMPAYSTTDISDAQMADLYAYLKSSNAAPPAQTTAQPTGNVQNGNVLYTKIGCYECHNRDGSGGGAGPRLAPNPISWQAFDHQVRWPSNAMPPYTTKVLSEQELADIYAFVLTFPKAPAVTSIPLQ